MKYKGSQKGASEVGSELNVGALIEGSVRKAGKRVRVTVQLINTSTEAHLWSSHYDKDLDDIFTVQSEIAEKVAEELKVQLVESEKRTLEKKPTENTEAYNDFLRGRELNREATESSVRQAIGLLEKAIELDPSFARARTELADSYMWLAGIGYEPREVALVKAKALLGRALQLDPDLPETHSSLAQLLYTEDDAIGSEAEARRALELNPSLPEPYRVLFEQASLRDEPEEMVKLIEEAYRLDPIRPVFIMLVGNAYVWTGRDRGSPRVLEKDGAGRSCVHLQGHGRILCFKGGL